ncbi:hypothetical protein E3U23_05205 [Erythrobacter litoralis]|uniref:SOS response-associated peptidase n=1 Tax=Erythrobacter litoralis TaxID=39960 RepID=UPI00243582DA|nr:SOS response-associated peptidase family protein [Erythrobacter litoralis]MDG6078591.1 hypothetical protein [Erythrobacter litoralis]
MCNLYRMTKNADEVAKLFDLDAERGLNSSAEIYPGYTGLVAAADGLKAMSWGFPLARTGAKGQPLKPKPINNARTDKLDGPFWKSSFVSRRCLIPVDAFAEAEGSKGAKTRTWFSLANGETMTVAGIWRDSAEWGACYSMVMTEACIHVASIHDRMPVIVGQSDRETWLAGPPNEAKALCRPFEGALHIDRTPEPWVGGAPATPRLL